MFISKQIAKLFYVEQNFAIIFISILFLTRAKYDLNKVWLLALVINKSTKMSSLNYCSYFSIVCCGKCAGVIFLDRALGLLCIAAHSTIYFNNLSQKIKNAETQRTIISCCEYTIVKRISIAFERSILRKKTFVRVLKTIYYFI